MQTALNIAIALALLFVVIVLGMGLWNMLKGGPGNTSQRTCCRLRVAGQEGDRAGAGTGRAVLLRRRARAGQRGSAQSDLYQAERDDGTTGLVRGPRRVKFDLRVEAYGTVDEANATIGQAPASIPARCLASTCCSAASRTTSSMSARTSPPRGQTMPQPNIPRCA